MAQRPVIRIHYSKFVCSVLKAKNDGELNFYNKLLHFQILNCIGQKIVSTETELIATKARKRQGITAITNPRD